LTTYWARDHYQLSYAIGAPASTGADLTDWDNAQAALVVGDLNALDWWSSASVTLPRPRTILVNPATSSHYPRRLQVGRYLGKFSTTHFLQTGVLTYALMGACTTTEAATNTHDITKSTGTTPCNLAFHLEKEGTNAQRRLDLMGFVPRSLDISVSEKAPMAYQTYLGEFSYANVAAADLACPTALTQATHVPYNWYHFKSASGTSAFLYGAHALNLDIVDLKMHLGWEGSLFGQYDANGYPNNGLVVPPFNSHVELGIRVQDAAVDTGIDAIADLVHTSYAHDIGFVADFYESATRYLKYTWADMYVDPESFEEVFQEEGEWYNGVKITLRFKDETSSLVVQEKNALNNDYYENPT
jgi:hypothetical protein